MRTLTPPQHAENLSRLVWLGMDAAKHPLSFSYWPTGGQGLACLGTQGCCPVFSILLQTGDKG